MRKFLTNIGIALGILLCVASIADDRLTHLFRRGRTVKAQWQDKMHGEHFDVAIIGSSRALRNIDMNAINARCGLHAISLANNHFRPAEMLLALKIFLRNGNTTKRLLIQVDSSVLTDEQEGFSSTLYDFVPFLEDTLIYDYLYQRDAEWSWLRHVPFWRYAKYNFKWGLEQTLRTALGSRSDPFDSTGSYFSPNDRFYCSYNYSFEPKIAPHFGEDLKALITLCRSNGIEPVVFSSPNFMVASPEAVRAAPHRLLAAEGLVLYDFSDSLNAEANFNDNRHLNRTGGALHTVADRSGDLSIAGVAN